MPLDVDLGANTRLPGVAPEMEILKPMPSGPPLPTKHTLRVVDPQAMSSYKHFGDLEQVQPFVELTPSAACDCFHRGFESHFLRHRNMDLQNLLRPTSALQKTLWANAVLLKEN